MLSRMDIQLCKSLALVAAESHKLQAAQSIDLIHKSQNAPVPYPTRLHQEQKCAHFCSEWRIVGYGTGALWALWKCPVLQGTHPFPKHRLAFSEMVWSHLKLLTKYPYYFKIMRYWCVFKFLSYTGKVSNNLVKRNICFWWQCCHLMYIDRVNFRFGLFHSYSVRGTCVKLQNLSWYKTKTGFVA